MLLILNFYKRHLRKLPLLVFLFASFNGAAQTFTLSFQRTPLATVFSQIEQQSDYRFLYTEELLARSVPVSFSVKNVSLDSVLHLSFLQQPLGYSIERKHIIVRKKVIEKPVPISRTLRGKVVNEQGEPLAGISITIKQTGFTTVSDANGEFSFSNAPSNVILLITGAEVVMQELEPGHDPFPLIVVHPKVSVLDETMVIAYGKTSRRLSTGTVSSIKKDEIVKQPVSNPLSILSGRVAGLQVSQVSGTPGAPFTVRLRGQNSIANGNDPLVIVDGVPFPTTSLNSFSGAGLPASPLAAINPSDIESIEVLKDADATAIYGSRGANGVILVTTRKPKAGKTQVQVRSYAGIGKVTKFIDLLNTSAYLKMRKEAFANDNTIPTAINAPDLLVWDTTRYTDWQKTLLGNTMHIYDTKLDLSGGSPQTQFLFNIGYHNESTVLPEDNFGEKKISAGLNINHKTTDNRLKFSSAANYTRNKTYLPQSDFSSLINLPPNAPKLFTTQNELNWENSTWQNPLSLLAKTYNSETENLNANLIVSYQLTKSIEGKVMFGHTMIRISDKMTTPKKSFDPAFTSASSAGFGNSCINTTVIEPQISYHKQIKKLNLDALVGQTLQSTYRQGFFQIGTGYASDELLNSLKAAATITPGTETDVRYRYTGLFGRVAFNLDQKYLLSFNARRDGSSRYGSANLFSNFGSVGFAYIFSNERALKKIKGLSFGKLKMSAGVTGNDQIGDYRYLDLYNSVSNTYQGVVPFQPAQLYNPSFNWEKVKKYEVGLDLGFLKDKFLLTINYYNNTTSNQLLQYALPPSTGFNGIIKNLPATIRNSGLEFEVNTNLISSKQFKWTSSINISIPKNKLVRFDNLAASTYANTYVLGQPLFISKAYDFTGVNSATGLYTFRDVDQDGKISSPNDFQSIVFTGQQYYGGLQNTFTWKNLSMSFLLQFVRQKNANGYLSLFGRPGIASNQPTLVTQRWQKPGDITTIQRYSYSNSPTNSAFNAFRQSVSSYDNASFIRGRNIYLGYSFGKQKQKQHWLVFIQGQNFFTITKYKSLDPETKSLMPPVKNLTAGIQFIF
jgi:TonB-linked SusC/RagA family outer membrane protein